MVVNWRFRFMLLSGTMLFVSGCAGIGTSRWAMDDDVYAKKYDDAYSGNDVEKAARLMKQATDARHVNDRGGYYLGAGGADEPTAAAIEIGRFQYSGSALETRAGLKGMVGTGENDWFAGIDLGARVQSPSRLAPFAGVGAYFGGNNHPELATNDHVDNDDDGSIDERGEKKDDFGFLASFYPEVGVHFWLTSSTRVTASAQYHLTTDGRDSDFWFLGFSLSFLDRADEAGKQD